MHIAKVDCRKLKKNNVPVWNKGMRKQQWWNHKSNLQDAMNSTG